MSYREEVDKKVIKEMQEERQKQGEKKKKIFFVVSFLLILAISGTIFGLFFYSPNDKVVVGDYIEKLQDSLGIGSKQSGGLNMKDTKEIKAELQAKTDASYMNYKINVNPVFKDGKTAGNLMIENVKGNPNIVQVVIKLDSDGSEVYKSPPLNPDEHIQEDKLSVALQKGNYPAIAYFKCYNTETKTLEGEAGMRINLTVQG